jgi:hypothetical protein
MGLTVAKMYAVNTSLLLWKKSELILSSVSAYVCIYVCMHSLKQINKPTITTLNKKFSGTLPHHCLDILLLSTRTWGLFSGKNTPRYWTFNSNIYVWWPEKQNLVKQFCISFKRDKLIKLAMPSQILNLLIHLGANVTTSFNSLRFSEENCIGLSLSLSLSCTHTHTHRYIYIYIYIFSLQPFICLSDVTSTYSSNIRHLISFLS